MDRRLAREAPAGSVSSLSVSGMPGLIGRVRTADHFPHQLPPRSTERVQQELLRTGELCGNMLSLGPYRTSVWWYAKRDDCLLSSAVKSSNTEYGRVYIILTT